VDELGLDGRVVAFTAFLSIATGLAFGLVPAIQAGRTDLQAALKEAGRGGTGDRFGHLTRRVLVVAEIALALTLLAGGGLLLRSFARVARVDPGFNPDHVLTFNLSLPAAKYRSDTTQRAFWRSLYPRLAAIPGVKAAGGTSVLPFGGNWSTASFNVEGYTPPPNGNGPWGDIRVVSPGFFQALEIGLVRGRYLDENDRAGSAPAVVVDEEFVKRFYPAGTDPVGRRIWFGPPTPDSTVTFFTIAGVVRHTAHEGLDAAARIQVYFAVDQSGPFGGQGGSSVVVRTAGEPMAAVSAVRAAIHELDPDLPLARIAPMSTLVENSLGQRRLSAILLGVFAGMALLLAALGIYGVMAYSVAQRVRELGVRLALGASREQVLRLVLGQGMSIAILGAVIGLVGAFGLTRLIASQLYQITATDPPTFSVVTLLLVGVAFIATLVPAWRATRVDPVEVLREE
jgi:predicted permease